MPLTCSENVVCFYICCIFSSLLRLFLIMVAHTMSPDQTLIWVHRLPKCIRTRIIVNGQKRVRVYLVSTFLVAHIIWDDASMKTPVTIKHVSM